jgi:hypothetical protein
MSTCNYSVELSRHSPKLLSFLECKPLEEELPEELIRRIFLFIDWKSRDVLSQVSKCWRVLTFTYSRDEFVFLTDTARDLANRFKDRIPEKSRDSLSEFIKQNENNDFRTLQDIRFLKDEFRKRLASSLFAHLSQEECQETLTGDILFSDRFQLNPFQLDICRAIELISSEPEERNEAKLKYLELLIEEICRENDQPEENLDLTVRTARESLSDNLRGQFIHKVVIRLLATNSESGLSKAIGLATHECAEGKRCRLALTAIKNALEPQIFKPLLRIPLIGSFAPQPEHYKITQFVHYAYAAATAFKTRGLPFPDVDDFLFRAAERLERHGYEEESLQLAYLIEDVTMRTHFLLTGGN